MFLAVADFWTAIDAAGSAGAAIIGAVLWKLWAYLQAKEKAWETRETRLEEELRESRAEMQDFLRGLLDRSWKEEKEETPE